VARLKKIQWLQHIQRYEWYQIVVHLNVSSGTFSMCNVQLGCRAKFNVTT